MRTTAKVAVSIPIDTLKSLDRESRRLKQSRSAVVTRAIRAWLRENAASEQDNEYVEGYLRQPEISSADAAAAVVSTWEPWE